MILVDSSVLIDVIEDQKEWLEWSVKKLHQCAMQDALCINIVIYAEIARSFVSVSDLNHFLSQAQISIEAIPNAAAFAAAKAHQAYRAAGGTRSNTLPDFFIGAHAQFCKFPLLTRDPSKIKTYFPKVNLIHPV
ncbi:MAG: hypothetical protein RL018_848 [Pseudomonadota bacterium]|jgi:predicted nucleic acid-binding protein